MQSEFVLFHDKGAQRQANVLRQNLWSPTRFP